MATPQTIATYSDALKEWYDGQRLMQLVLQSSPGLAMMSKSKMGGRQKPLPMVDSYTPGHSADYTTANTNKGGVTTEQFQLTSAKHYALAQLDRQLVLASEGVGAFMPAAKQNIDGAMKQLRRDLAIHLYRDGTGARGRVLTFAAGVITLTERYDAVNFSRGDKLRFNAVKTGTTVDATVFTVTAVDTVAGTLTGTTDVGPAPDPNDWIFADGDKGVVMKGWGAWLPTVAPTVGDNFFTVDRSVNPTMFAGVRSDATGKLLHEAIIDGQSEIVAIGDGVPKMAFIHPSAYRRLIKELEQQVVRPKPVQRELQVMKDSKALVGFSGIVVQGDVSEIEVYADRFQQPTVCHLIEPESAGIAYIGDDFVELVSRESDRNMLLDDGADSYTVRAVSYPQAYFTAPGHSATVFNFGGPTP